jgi:hypothetical protein
MILKEYGMKKLFEKVFESMKFPEDMNDSSIYFEGKIEYLNLSEEGKLKVEEFFSTFNEFNLEILNAALSMNAYKHVSSSFKEKLDKYIERHKSLIFSNIDKIVIDEADINKVNVQIYEVIKKSDKIDITFLSNVCSLAIYRKDLFNEHNYYGISNLFTYLCINFHKEFTTWYLNTKREDLKTIFTSISLCTHYIFDFATPELSKSPIMFIRTISKIIEYNLDRTIGYPSFEKTFLDLDKNEEENLLFVLYSYRYKFDDKIREEDFKRVASFSRFFTKEILIQFLHQVIDKKLLALFILNISDLERKEELLKEFITHINKSMNKDDIIFTENFLKELEVYSILINNSQNALVYVKLLENNFKKICIFMSSPYIYYRETQKWQSNIKILVSHLVVLSILEEYKNINEFYDLYISTKKQFNCYQEKEINNILNRVIK